MTEFFDVLTEAGTPTGEVLPRQVVHDRGLWHGSVHTWIVNAAGEYLLQQRAISKKTDPGLWDLSVCGHIAAGDDAITTALREAKEELGLILDPGSFEYLLTYARTNEHPLNGGTIRYERLISPTYIVRAEVDLKSLRLEPTEVAAVRWLGFDELHDSLANPPHQYAIRPDEWQQLLPILEKRSI